MGWKLLFDYRINIFGNQKRQNSATKNEKFLTNQTNRIIRLVDSLWKACRPKNVATVFRLSGLLVTCRPVDGIATVYVEVRRGAVRAVRHYNTSLLERNIEQNIPLWSYTSKLNIIVNKQFV